MKIASRQATPERSEEAKDDDDEDELVRAGDYFKYERKKLGDGENQASLPQIH